MDDPFRVGRVRWRHHPGAALLRRAIVRLPPAITEQASSLRPHPPELSWTRPTDAGKRFLLTGTAEEMRRGYLLAEALLRLITQVYDGIIPLPNGIIARKRTDQIRSKC